MPVSQEESWEPFLPRPTCSRQTSRRRAGAERKTFPAAAERALLLCSVTSTHVVAHTWSTLIHAGILLKYEKYYIVQVLLGNIYESTHTYMHVTINEKKRSWI